MYTQSTHPHDVSIERINLNMKKIIACVAAVLSFVAVKPPTSGGELTFV